LLLSRHFSDLKWIARKGVSQIALGKLARRPERFSQGRPLIAGFHSSPIGLGEGVRLLRSGFEKLGLAPAVFDLTPGLQPERALFEVAPAADDDGLGPIILHINPPEISKALGILRRSYNLKQRYLIALWAWELPKAPPHWDFFSRWFDEVWTPSDFVCKAFEGRFATPVYNIGYPIPERGGRSSKWRERLNPAGGFTAFTACDARSSVARKNPEGALRAFLKAFSGNPSARIIVKITGAIGDFPDSLQTLLRQDQVIVMDRFLSPREMQDLIGACDCAINLHRAEGFGLVPALASRQGLPVVVTAWSGAAAYLDCPNIFGVDYHLTTVEDPDGFYTASLGPWAEPDIEHAASLLRDIAGMTSRDQKALSARARQWWEENADAHAFWRRLPERSRSLMPDPRAYPVLMESKPGSKSLF